MKILVCVKKFEFLRFQLEYLNALLLNIECKNIEIILLHSLPNIPISGSRELQNELRIIAKDQKKFHLRRLDQLSKLLKSQLIETNVYCESIIVEDEFKNSLKVVLAQQEIDLVVVFPEFNTKLFPSFEPRNLNWIIDDIMHPILVLPINKSGSEVPIKQFKSIGLVDNGMTLSKISEVYKRYFKGEVSFITIGERNFNDNVMLKMNLSFLNKLQLSDLIIVNHKHRGLLSKLLNTSFTKKLFESIRTPILIIQ